jgi:hypothetical protein
MRFFALFGISLLFCVMSLRAQIIDSSIVPEDTARAAVDSSKIPTAEDSARVSRDSVAKAFIGLNEHIGPNAVAFFGSLIWQTYGVNTRLSQTYTFGAGLSGDVLTGLPFLHLVPQLQYWSYSENSIQGVFNRQTYRDVSLAFNAVIVSQRMTSGNSGCLRAAAPPFI